MVRINEIVETVDNKADYDRIMSVKNMLSRYFTITGNLKINEQNLIDLDGSCEIKHSIVSISRLPVKFLQVSSWFYCSGVDLESLVGAPQKVGGDFYCSNNKLTSLVGAPKTIGGEFSAAGNMLTSLEGVPEYFFRGTFTWHAQMPLLRLVGKLCGLLDAPLCTEILRTYVGKATRSSILACQKELIDAGFEDNASW
jgi:hypothetical protein